jgi:hypothetical protein
MNDVLDMYSQINASLRSVQTHLDPETAGYEAFQQALADYESSLLNTTGLTSKMFENIRFD